MSAINIAGSRLTLKGVGESHQGKGGNLEKLMEGLKRRFPSVDAAVLSFFKRRELLLLASVPPHNHREPCHPDASDDGHEPLLPRHAGKLEQDGVNPAHGSLTERPILGAGGAIRKAERGNMPDRVGAAAAGVGRDRATPGWMGCRQPTVMLRAVDFDRDCVSGINSRCRMARMDLSKWHGDRGLSWTWAG
jgi:hypothetical protein